MPQPSSFHWHLLMCIWEDWRDWDWTTEEWFTHILIAGCLQKKPYITLLFLSISDRYNYMDWPRIWRSEGFRAKSQRLQRSQKVTSKTVNTRIGEIYNSSASVDRWVPSTLTEQSHGARQIWLQTANNAGRMPEQMLQMLLSAWI